MSMQADQNFAERRREKRYELKKFAKVTLYLTPDRRNIDVKVVNISRSGMSFYAPEEIAETSEAYLSLNGQNYPLVPVWSLPSAGRTNSFLYGFNCAQRKTDLVRIFAAAGLPLSKATEKIQSEEERFVEEFSTIEFAAFPGEDEAKGDGEIQE